MKKSLKIFLFSNFKKFLLKNQIWIGFDIEPSQEITGGVWCTNQEFDKNLVEVMENKVLEYIGRVKITTRKEIAIFIKSIGLIQVYIF